VGAIDLAKLVWPIAIVLGVMGALWALVGYLRRGAVASYEVKESEQALKVSQEVSDAQAQVKPPTVTSDWLSRGGVPKDKP